MQIAYENKDEFNSLKQLQLLYKNGFYKKNNKYFNCEMSKD